MGSATLGFAVPRVGGEWVAEMGWRSGREGSAAFEVDAGLDDCIGDRARRLQQDVRDLQRY